MKKRVMIVGATQAGKSTLANFLNGSERPLKKTQDVIYGLWTIDTPGSYIENPSMYRYLIAAAQDAGHILLLVEQTCKREVYPPGFGKIFSCPVIGVVTKTDLAPENASKALAQLKRAGVTGPCFRVSAEDRESVERLRNYLQGAGAMVTEKTEGEVG